MKTLLVALLISSIFVSCGGYTTETIQKAEKSFLKFIGTPQGTMIAIDDGTSFAYNPEIQLYSLAPGKHTVKVSRNGQMLIDRTVFLDNQVIMEIEVP
jgi:hypothetical protein